MIDPLFRDRVHASFGLLQQRVDQNRLPAADSLSSSLVDLFLKIPKKEPKSKNVTTDIAKMFTTAAVNMWLRSVHSFLISAALTDVSPIWASSAGYYSSHYSIRAFAHLLGLFRVFPLKRMVRLENVTGRHICSSHSKAGREHEIYWQMVKQDGQFRDDPIFTSDGSEVAHRDWANYADHLPQMPKFRSIEVATLKIRIEKISRARLSSPIKDFPDIDYVQVAAYRRIGKFRDLVDNVVGVKNGFWRLNRDPSWATEFMNFRPEEEEDVRTIFTR
jgi:hypothetical protein